MFPATDSEVLGRQVGIGNVTDEVVETEDVVSVMPINGKVDITISKASYR